MCQVGAAVACWSLKQEVAGWQGFEPFYCNQIFLSLNSTNSLKTFRKNSNRFEVISIGCFAVLNISEIIENWSDEHVAFNED